MIAGREGEEGRGREGGEEKSFSTCCMILCGKYYFAKISDDVKGRRRRGGGEECGWCHLHCNSSVFFCCLSVTRCTMGR